jgi:GAF domain-containing protein
MSSPWLAIGAETDPLRRARQLQRSWERLLSGGALARELPPGATKGLRPTIVESWRRSLATGLDPTHSLAPIEADESEVLERWYEHPLGSLAHVITEELRKVADESRSVVVLTDASGLVLHRMGEQGLKELAAEQNHLVEGARWSEVADGTNGIGTALAAGRAFQVFAFEHFNERHHQWICSGAPIHDPVSGQTIGLIDLSSLWKIELPRSLALVTTAARTIEQRLLEVRRDHDARLRRRYGDLMTRGTDLLVNRDGYVLEGASPELSKPLDMPEDGGEVVLGDGSVAVAASLGQGEAYLLRRIATRRARSAPVEVLERAETHLRELVAEQSALRHVATLVARESAPDQLFTGVAEQVARVFAVPHVRLVRFEPEGSVVAGGFSDGDHEFFPIGSRWPLFSTGAIATVRQTGRPARAEDYSHLTGEVAAVFHAAGVRSAVASPIVVEGRLWGAMVVHSRRGAPFPESTEARLADFTVLVATAIANAEARGAVARLADEHAALRRVATLVAQGSSPEDLFAAVAEEVGRLLPVGSATMGRFEPDESVTTVASWSATENAFPPGMRWPTGVTKIAWAVLQTGEASRIDDFSAAIDPIGMAAREAGMKSAVGGPIVVEGHVWGLITVTSTQGSLPPDTEARLSSFTELVATAVANSEAREALAQLADEQAALRRVATLVAQDTVPAEIFTAVSAEVDRVFRLDPATLDIAVVGRFDDGPELVVVGLSKRVEGVPIGSRWPPDDLFAPTHVRRTGRSARIRADDVRPAGGEVAEFLRQHGYLSQVASPIVVDGRLWGAMSVNTANDLPQDSEERLARFTELVATAIANARSRETLARLVDEQSALRRVATLVAEEAAPARIFAAVCEQVGHLLEADFTALEIFPHDGTATVIAVWNREGPSVPVGTQFRFEPGSIPARILATRAPVRRDGYSDVHGELGQLARELQLESTVGAPILVGGRLWGALVAATRHRDPWAEEAEARLSAFSELVATSIANAESRDALARLADEQAALRRVATLVARDAPAGEVFDAVATEVGKLLDADVTVVGRYDQDGAATAIGSWSSAPGGVPVGTRSALGGRNVLTLVAETKGPARVDGYDDGSGEAAEIARRHGWRSSIAAPISVEGRLWGVMLVATKRSDPFPAGEEERLSAFTDLVATAIANAEGKSELAASRRRIVAAADEARRRIERDLHDGIQQRLIALTFRARAMTRRPPNELPGMAAELSDGLKEVSDELREVSRGIHPTILTEAGLGPALRALARRSEVPVDVDVRVHERLPAPVEAAAYYIASEALTNVAKHADANAVAMIAAHDNGILILEIRDDGVGGVDATRGSGILGLADRVEALGGMIAIASPPLGGTTLSVRLPIAT